MVRADSTIVSFKRLLQSVSFEVQKGKKRAVKLTDRAYFNALI